MFKKYGILFLMLAIPAILYILYVNVAENNYQKLPVYGPKEAFSVTRNQKRPDTLYHQLIPLQKQLERLPNKVLVVSFFPSNDLTNSRLRYRQLARVEDVFKANPLIWLVNLHPEPDSALPAYMTVYDKKLNFEAGSSNLPVELEKNMMVYFPDWKALHPKANFRDLTFLVDKDLRVRGMYRTVIRTEADKLMEDIRTLIVEYANTEPKRR